MQLDRIWLNTRSLAPKVRMSEQPKRIVAYASQQGTSEEIAGKIGTATSLPVVNFQTLTAEQLQQLELVIFVPSSYGRGDPPSDCADAWEAINALEGESLLSNLRFAVYACGSMRFRRTFCGFGVKICQKLKALGAKEIVPMGTNDEQETNTTDLDEWIASLNL